MRVVAALFNDSPCTHDQDWMRAFRPAPPSPSTLSTVSTTRFERIHLVGLGACMTVTKHSRDGTHSLHQIHKRRDESPVLESRIATRRDSNGASSPLELHRGGSHDCVNLNITIIARTHQPYADSTTKSASMAHLSSLVAQTNHRTPQARGASTSLRDGPSRTPRETIFSARMRYYNICATSGTYGATKCTGKTM